MCELAVRSLRQGNLLHRLVAKRALLDPHVVVREYWVREHAKIGGGQRVHILLGRKQPVVVCGYPTSRHKCNGDRT
jgi:hypothetical protein